MSSVQVEKDGSTIEIDEALLAEHKALGWKVSIVDLDLRNAAITIGAEATDTINVAVQLLNSQGTVLAEEASVLAFLCDDTDGVAVTATGPDGHVAAGTTGGCTHLVTDKFFMLHADANGQVDVDIVDSGTPTWYLILVFPTGKRLVSGAITFA